LFLIGRFLKIFSETALPNQPKFQLILSKRFQRRRFLESTNQKQELPVAAMFVNGSGGKEHSL
jgi:hypothetical protein